MAIAIQTNNNNKSDDIEITTGCQRVCRLSLSLLGVSRTIRMWRTLGPRTMSGLGNVMLVRSNVYWDSGIRFSNSDGESGL